jgi:hypothetical protein
VVSGRITVGMTEDEPPAAREQVAPHGAVAQAATPHPGAVSEPVEPSAAPEEEDTAPEPLVPEIAVAGPQVTVSPAAVGTPEPPPEISPVAAAGSAPQLPEHPVPSETPQTPVPAAAPAVPAAAPAGAGTGSPGGIQPGDRFVAAADARTPPEETAAQIGSIAGGKAQPIVDLLDGSRTIQEIADALEVPADQVGQVVRVLVGARLAFRYVSRARPATGARSPG